MTKLIFSFYASLILILFTGFTSADRTAYDSTPAIFEHDNCRGTYSYVDISRSDLGNFGWNDAISSVTVPDNWKLVFYQHKDFCGSSFTVHPGTHNFRDYNWNDKASSVKVYYYGSLQGFAYSCQQSNGGSSKPYVNDDPGGKW